MERPIFLVGTMRSGSTLLRLILDSHERIAIGEESGFMRAVAATKNIPHHHSGAAWYRRFGVSDDEMNERLRRFYDDLFSSYARAQGKARWGDKTPFHAKRIREISELFDDAVFVGIVRHPGAVVGSQRRRGTSVDRALRGWLHTNATLLRASRWLGDRLAVLRYEDLVAQPEPTLRELLDFLGEPWSPALLRHHEVQRDKGAPRVVEGGTRTRDPIDARRADRWSGELPVEQRERVAALTAALREVFAYDEHGALPFTDITGGVASSSGRHVLRGGELHARQRAVGRAALTGLREVPPPPAPSGSPRDAARHLLRMIRTDAPYALRRLPTVVRARRTGRG